MPECLMTLHSLGPIASTIITSNEPTHKGSVNSIPLHNKSLYIQETENRSFSFPTQYSTSKSIFNTGTPSNSTNYTLPPISELVSSLVANNPLIAHLYWISEIFGSHSIDRSSRKLPAPSNLVQTNLSSPHFDHYSSEINHLSQSILIPIVSVPRYVQLPVPNAIESISQYKNPMIRSPYHPYNGHHIPHFEPTLQHIPNSGNFSAGDQSIFSTSPIEIPTTLSQRQVKRRTRTGCMTCRKRRIKCDEAKPECKNCARRKVHCMGYQSVDPDKKSQAQYKLKNLSQRSQNKMSVLAIHHGS